MPADQFHPGGIGRATEKGSDPRGLIRAANRTTIAAIVDSVICNESLLALIGEAGTGKTTLASMLREELASRSVRALLIPKGGSGEFSVRQIVAEVLGGPQSELSSADVQTFIEVMTRREEPAQRLVLVIDDAECLQPDALSCLLLLASLPRAVAAQVVFIGRPRFWRVLGHTDGAEGNGLIRRHWELAEPPGRGRRTPDQVASKRWNDDPSADAPAPEDAAETPDEREETAEPIAKPPRQRRYLSLVAAAAVAMVVASPMPLPQPPSQLPDNPSAENSRLGGRVRSDQPSLEHMRGTTLATTQVGPAGPRFPLIPAPPDTKAADAWLELPQPSAGGLTTSAISTTRDNPAVLLNVGEVAVQTLPTNPSDGAGTLLFAAAPVSAREAPAWAGADEVAGLNILQPPEEPSVAVATKDTVPQPSANAASLPETVGATGSPASAASQAETAAAEAASQAAASAAPSSSGSPEPPDASARPSTDTLIESIPSEPPAAAPAVAEEGRAAEPLAATIPTAPARTENPMGTVDPVPHLSAEAAPLPEKVSGTKPPASAVPQPGSAAAEAASQVADRVARITELPIAAARPVADAPPSEPAAASAVTETSGRGGPLAATDVAATEPTATAATAAETAPHVEETSKAREPLLVDEPPHVAAIETSAPHSSSEIALAPPKIRSTAEHPSAYATAENISPQAPPTEAAPSVAQTTSGAPSAHAATTAPASDIAPASVPTDKGQAGRAASSPLHPAPDASPPLDLTLLLSRADSMLGLGDISAARRLYERAAALGSARAATAVGKTYDAAFLATIGAQGIVPDQAAASEWYRKAAALGDREAADRLAKLTPRN